MFRKQLTIFIVAIGMLTSCSSQPLFPMSTPLPGWNRPVTELFVELESLPDGWAANPYEDENATDVRINHVSRSFFNSNPDRYDKVIQDIWRANTTAEAERKFDDLARGVRTRGWLPRFPSTSFGPVSQIAYQSRVADKWELVCGIDVIAECRFLARYRNYVTDVYFTLQYDGYEGLSFTEIETLSTGIDGQFRAHLGLTETALGNPSYLSLTPVALYSSEPGFDIRQIFLEVDALPQDWSIAFQDWENVTISSSGRYLASRNFYHDNCYENSPELDRCFITEFVVWYPNTQDAEEEWQRKYSEINLGGGSHLGVWRVPDDITFSDANANQSFVACSEVAGGEHCEAILRFDNYLIALIADMESPTTLMGHAKHGITHEAFAELVGMAALQARTVLDTEK